MARGMKRRVPSLLFGWLAAAGALAQQQVQVPSLELREGRPLVLSGHWFPASPALKSPALVLLHGCGGMLNKKGQPAERYTALAARLNALGIHALVLDSLTPRGETELCTRRLDTRQVKQPQRRRDALGALQWLAAQPRVDATKLGLLGWSNGGSTVLASTNRRHAEVAAAPVQPSLAVAFYPGCEAELRAGYEPTAPLLMLLGEADDWTPVAPCKALAAQSSGHAPRWESYLGAHHGFDGTAPVRLRKDVPNGVNPGQGVHVGGNPAARAASALALEKFLRRTWVLPG
jgi:dienelactone hydrolase